MVKDKDIRPTRARLLGNVLPDMATILTKTMYEDFHVKRSNGTNVTYKGKSVTTQNLNSIWVETQISITEISCTTLNEEGNVVVHLYNKETNAPLGNEEVIIRVGDYDFIRVTNSKGFAGVFDLKLTEPGEYVVSAEYYGNSHRSLLPAEDDVETFTIGKLNVTITQANLTGKVGDTFTIKPTVKDSNGDLVTSGSLQMNYGSYTLFTEPVSNGTCTFNRQINQAVQYTYWLKFLGNSTHNPATCNFTITVNRITPSLTTEGGTIHSTKLGTPYEVSINYLDGNGNPITTGTVHLYEGDQIVDTAQRVENGKIILTYPANVAGSHVLRVKANETSKYTSVSQTLSMMVQKLNTTTSISLNDLYDFPSTNNNFTITVTDEKGNAVTSGTVDLVFTQDKISETSTVATYDLAGTGGTITVSRQNVLLDDLYDKIKARKYLYYTGYNVTANYAGGTNYNNSTDTKYPMNIHMYSSIIRPVFVINSNPDYDMSTTYPTVPTDNSSLAEFHIRPDTTGSSNHYYVLNNRRYTLNQDTTKIQMGSVTRGQVIHVATDYIASHVPDTQRATTNLNSIEMYSVGGLNTEIHYQINDGEEIDTATAQVNGGTTRYTVPRYVKFTVPNTVVSGDTLTLIFYVGRNVGYYDIYDDTYGFRYALQWEVD